MPSARSRRRAAYATLFGDAREPELKIVRCTVARPLTVVRVDVPSTDPHQSPLVPQIIATDAAKEEFVTSSPPHIDGLWLLVEQHEKDQLHPVCYSEVVLKSSVPKRLSMYKTSWPRVNSLPDAIVRCLTLSLPPSSRFSSHLSHSSLICFLPLPSVPRRTKPGLRSSPSPPRPSCITHRCNTFAT